MRGEEHQYAKKTAGRAAFFHGVSGMHPWITLHIQQALVEQVAEHEMVSREGERPDGARQRAGHAAKQRVSEVRRRSRR